MMASMDRGMRRNPAARPRRRATEQPVEEVPEEVTVTDEEPTQAAETAAPAAEEPQEAPVAPEEPETQEKAEELPEEPETQEKAEELPEGLTVEQTLAWVGHDGTRAQIALDGENQRDKPRKWALKELEKLVQADLL